MQVTLTAGPYTTTSTSLYDVYDSSQLTSAEADGRLVISPPWIDFSGSDDIRIVTTDPAFASTDRPKLRITSRAPPPSSRRLAATPTPLPPSASVPSPLQTLHTDDCQGAATFSVSKDGDVVLVHHTTFQPAADLRCDAPAHEARREVWPSARKLLQEEVSEVNCTVVSEREASCPSGSAAPGATLELAMARNGQDFVALASEVCLAASRLLALLCLQLCRHWLAVILSHCGTCWHH